MQTEIIHDTHTGKYVMILTMPQVDRQFTLYLGVEDMKNLKKALEEWWEKENTRTLKAPVEGPDGAFN